MKALCLSGGGYRAMLFHTGSIGRLLEAGYRPDTISSVSGGSILAAKLAQTWALLKDDDFALDTYHRLVWEPIDRLAQKTMDVPAIIRGGFGPNTINKWMANKLDKMLELDGLPYAATPTTPHFLMHSTNLQTTQRFTFERRHMVDAALGKRRNDATLAQAAAASAAFPPVLGPRVFQFDPGSWQGRPKTEPEDRINDAMLATYRGKVILSDGGVHDNFGIDAVDDAKEILVCNAGGHAGVTPHVSRWWHKQGARVVQLLDHQSRFQRKDRVVRRYRLPKNHPSHLGGTYWSVRLRRADYPARDFLRYDEERAMQLGRTPTRLRHVKQPQRHGLVNWGYVAADIAYRSYVDPKADPATDWLVPGGLG